MLLFKPANSWKFIPESVYYQSALSDPGHALSFLLTPAFQSFPPLPPQLPTFVVSKPKLLLSCKVSDNLTHKWWTTHSVENYRNLLSHFNNKNFVKATFFLSHRRVDFTKFFLVVLPYQSSREKDYYLKMHSVWKNARNDKFSLTKKKKKYLVKSTL